MHDKVDIVEETCLLNALPLSPSRLVRSIHDAELQIRSRDFRNEILVSFDQCHPSVLISVWPTYSLKFNIDLTGAPGICSAKCPRTYALTWLTSRRLPTG